MFELASPWALLLLPLPLLMLFVPPYRESRDSVQVPFFDKLVALSERQATRGSAILERNLVQRILVSLMWLALVLAAARPEWIGPPVERQKAGRDLMVAVDLSGSMEARDFTLANGSAVDRLEAVKYVMRPVAAQRESDRLGLIVFGDAAYLQTPFTEDHDTWLQLLEETAIGMAGQSTVLGDAIGLAIKLFLENDTDQRVLIVLTDGNDTGSTVPPVDAAKVAAAHDIRIYPIAMGDPTTVGEEALDLETLKRVADVTGGRTFQALDREQLEQARQGISQLEPELYETISFRPRQSLHYLPVGFALVLFLIYHSLSAGLAWWRHRPAAAGTGGDDG
jgi:Ca-activated chloride channel family protein